MLTNRAQQYITTAEDRKAELAHVDKALRANDYPEWALALPTPSEHQRDNDSSHTYVGETKRPLSQRFKEHTNLDKPTNV